MITKSSCYKLKKGIMNIEKLKNKKLVNILNHKIFKGYNDIKNSKSFCHQIPKCVKIVDYENDILEPFDDNYNLLYKKKYLSKLSNNNKIKNSFLIHNISFNQQNNTMNKKFNLNSNNNILSNIKKQENNIKYNKILSDKKKRNFNSIFPDMNEAKIYSNIPLLFFKRYFQKPNSLREKLIMSTDKYYNLYDGLNVNQFLYKKISHNNIQNYNSFKMNNQIKKVFPSRQIKYNENREIFMNNLNTKCINIIGKRKRKENTQETGTQMTINKSFNENKSMGNRNVFYKNLVFQISLKKNDSTYNSEIKDNISNGTNSKKK